MANLVITKTLLDNRFTVNAAVASLTTGVGSETELLADYGDPVVSVGGTIDVTTEATPMTVTSSVGYIVGETITGQTSLETAVVWKLATGVLWVTDISGTFTVGGENILGATSAVTTALAPAGVGTAMTQFQVNNGYAPNSTANFAVPLATRRCYSELSNVTWTLDGDLIAEAEDNALDLILQIKTNVTAVWTIFKSHMNTYDGVDTTPLP